MKITNKKLRGPRKGYRVVAWFAHGDDDYHSKAEHDGLGEETAARFVEMLSWLADQPRLDETDEMWDQLRAAPHYAEMGGDYWPSDVIYNTFCRPARLDGYQVEYVDGSGNVWEVEP